MCPMLVWAVDTGCVPGCGSFAIGSAAILPLQSPSALRDNRSGWGQREVTSAVHPWGSCLTDHVTSHRAAPGPPLLPPSDPRLFLSPLQAVLQLQELQNVQSGAQSCSLGGG